MPVVDWNYHRKNCNSCSLAEAFFEQHGITIHTRVDARTVPLSESEAFELIDKAKDLFVTRGKKVVHFDLSKKPPAKAEITELIIGRSGKLRAPTIQIGSTVVIGFDRETYEIVLLNS